MTIIQAIILGCIEGLTEFLPISSTGHLVLTSNILHIPSSSFTRSFEIIIQLAAILAVAVIYLKRYITDWQSYKKITVAFLPTAIVGFTLFKQIKGLLDNDLVVVITLGLGGVLLILFDKIYHPSESAKEISQLSYRNAAMIGLFQSISVIPGVSRSAATIIGGFSQNLTKKAAVEFSFLLAIPTMLAATGYDLIKTGINYTSSEYVLLAVGCTVAFASALVAVKFFISYVQKHSFTIFGIYRIGVAVAYYFLILKNN